MRACLDAGCDYIDMASGGTDDDGIPKMEDQFALDAEFKAAGRIALLGMGADPGTTNVYAAYAAKHLLDEITELRVRDGDNSVCQGHDGFVAAFSPWVFIDECLCKAVSLPRRALPPGGAAHGIRAVRFPRARRAQLLLRGPRGVEARCRVLPARARVVDFKLCMDDVTIETLAGHEAARAVRQGPGPGGRHLGGAARRRGLAAARSQGPRGPDARQDLRRDPGARASRTASRGPSTSTTSPITRRPTPSWACRRRRTRPASRRSSRRGSCTRAAGRGPGVRSPEEFDPDPFLERLAREGHAVARPGRHGAGGAAEGAHPAVAGRPWRRSGSAVSALSGAKGDHAGMAPFAALRVTTVTAYSSYSVIDCPDASYPAAHRAAATGGAR